MTYPKQASLATRLGMPAVQPQRPTVASSQADQGKLDEQRLAERARELTQPNLVRPALIDPAEVELAREKFKTPIAALAAIEAMADIRLSWLNVREGLKGIVVLTPAQTESAMNFFTTHPDRPAAPALAPVAPQAPATPQRPAPLTPDSGLLLRIAKAAEESVRVQGALLAELKSIHTLLESRPVGQAAPAAGQGFKDFLADSIVLGYDDAGKPTYKVKGPDFKKHGVRVWPEILEVLGVNAEALKPGPNPYGPKMVRALLGPGEDEDKIVLKKIIGLAE